tara:strand:- start:886 stop:1389 length:504 start_codon:yes stop_codon:yes gene_type:complete
MTTFKQTYETITQSKIFKDFIEKNKDAELIAGFFILDFLSNDTKTSLDYKIDSKIFTFSLNKDNETTVVEDKLIDKPGLPVLTKINPDIKTDLNEIPSIAQKQAEENKITAKFHKIIAVLQNHEDQEVWNLTCMLDQLIILHILINAKTGEIIKFERKNMMDFIRKK